MHLIKVLMTVRAIGSALMVWPGIVLESLSPVLVMVSIIARVAVLVVAIVEKAQLVVDVIIITINLAVRAVADCVGV